MAFDHDKCAVYTAPSGELPSGHYSLVADRIDAMERPDEPAEQPHVLDPEVVLYEPAAEAPDGV